MLQGNAIHRRGAIVLALFAMLLTVFVGAPRASAGTSHCADHTTEVKVDVDDLEDGQVVVDVLDTRTGDLVAVVVTITGSDFTIEAVDPSITLIDADWCIKSAQNTNSGNGLAGTSTSTNHQGEVQDISYMVVVSVTSEDPTPIQECNEETTSGGAGVTTTNHQLGEAGPTEFLFQWETLNQPDQLEVFYEGALIYDTGLVGDNINEGTGSDTVTVPAGTDTFVTVTVTGPEAGTLWSYIVNCPSEE